MSKINWASVVKGWECVSHSLTVTGNCYRKFIFFQYLTQRATYIFAHTHTHTRCPTTPSPSPLPTLFPLSLLLFVCWTFSFSHNSFPSTEKEIQPSYCVNIVATDFNTPVSGVVLADQSFLLACYTIIK